MSNDRKPYNVDRVGYAFGPYSSEAAARRFAMPDDTTIWLAPTDIDEWGKAGPFPPER